MGGQFLTAEGRGLHLLQKSRSVCPWTEQEEWQWVQLVGSVFPVNSYLQRTDKHPTGHCPFGCTDENGEHVKETITHFQSGCKKFVDNHTAAHHAITKAVMGALADSNVKGW